MPTETEELWLAAWRRAGPELERIRREELRNLPETPVVEPPEAPAASDAREKASSGLVAWQQWMMRLRILELQKQRAGHDSPSSPLPSQGRRAGGEGSEEPSKADTTEI